ncbi:unnamed protein product [Ilex paraguariensis]|uniref:Ataxin-10 domain-containing protein n=1 Tax=Ilex paraguariensis TaxID=185542 RepID=A0ABC8QP50_9AQUA
MDDDDEFSVPEDILWPLFTASSSSTIEKALTHLIPVARGAGGRADLASKNILTTVLQLCRTLSCPSNRHLLLLSLKLLRNLCAGEISNQNSFIQQNGVQIVSGIFNSVGLVSESDYEIVKTGLQVLGNVSLAGEEHQHTVWHQFFPLEFSKIARVRSRETCDPLCMVIYTCSEGSHVLSAELDTDQGLHIVAEITESASAVGFRGDWLKLLLSRICLEKYHFSQLFSKLCPIGNSGTSDDIMSGVDHFVPELAFLLSILSEILNEQIRDITVSNAFGLHLLGIFRSAFGAVDFSSRGKSGLPTGSAAIDALGYSLIILRDICASDGLRGSKGEGTVDVNVLLSSGLLELLLSCLRELEPPAIIRKTIKQSDNQEGSTHFSSEENHKGTTYLPKFCPYKGFRRDLVAVVGNCVYQRKHVQDEIRQKKAILLLLQQCVTDEDNPFLREWGIWSVRNLLEGNVENQRVVSDLELQGSVDVPEIVGLGLRVEVDQKTGRAKLVNA